MADATLNKDEHNIDEPKSLYGRLDLILSEVLKIDLHNYADEELWNALLNKDFGIYNPFHCVLLKFGEIKEVPRKSPHSNQKIKQIEVYYKGKLFTKNLTDFCYNLKDKFGKQLNSRIILPWYFNDYYSFFTFDNIPYLLENKYCLLLYSITGTNKYGKQINAWTLVALKDNLTENAKILREYIIKAKENTLWFLFNAPNNFFDFDIPEHIKNDMLRPLVDVYTDIRYHMQKNSIAKTKGPFRKKTIPQRHNEDDYIEYHEPKSSEDSYLDDELDYIRQNGGDWIDD